MTIVEFGVATVMFSLMVFIQRFGRQTWPQVLTAFTWAAALGFGFQISLGPELNVYNQSVQIYIGYVSLALIINWCIVLNICYFFAWGLIARFRLSPPLLYYILAGLITMVLLEAIGYNTLKMRLEAPYPSLMPCLNCMHAPVGLYAAYAFVAITFYLSMNRFRAFRRKPANTAGLLPSPDSRP